ncbi:hypothetical protein ACFW9M_17165, partial [Streptomyces lydicus]|uniref:hypothetical protein n=1 Tax=Streptomyces lydicus TaxID=47763 RepID=UPI0036C9C8F4
RRRVRAGRQLQRQGEVGGVGGGAAAGVGVPAARSRLTADRDSARVLRRSVRLEDRRAARSRAREAEART